MKLLPVATLFALLCAQCESQGLLNSIPNRGLLNNLSNAFGLFDIAKKPCERDPLRKFKDALDDFTVRLTKRASYYTSGHFIVSPYTMWLSLASLAEFADKSVQKELFTALNLPEEKCIRDKFYQLALNLETPGQDARFERNRALAIDERATLNDDWIAFSKSTNTLKYLQVPYNAETFEHVQKVMGVQSKFALDGHSIFLDRLEYEGLWTSAFPDGSIEKAPFYNDLGQQIAMVEYMRMKSRVRLAHIPIIDAKVLELPVGTDGRYTMLLTMGVQSNTVNKILELLRSSIIVDIMSAMTLSLVPIEVAVPRFSMSTGFNARPMLEDLGLSRVFADPAATRYVSDPPALPCCYLQRVSINITSATMAARSRDDSNILSGLFNIASNTATGLASAIGRDFIANKPFLFTLIDTKTKVTVFTGVYSQPDGPEADGNNF